MRKSIEGGVRTTKRRRMFLALALVGGFAVQSIAIGPGMALADRGVNRHHTADVSFTKWIVVPPTGPGSKAGVQMVGVVGGDVGSGDFAGQVFSDDTVSQPGFWLAHVRYEFFGRKRAFGADIHVTEDDTKLPITATIQGVVTQGFLKGAHVTGEYTQFDSCPIATPGNVFGTLCFQGTLHLQQVDDD